MIWTLRLFFAVILIAMLSVTSWASLHENILQIPEVVQNDPWFIATLFDAYAGFLTFFAWLCYRDKGGIFKKVLCLIAILLLGNIAMSFYMLILLFSLPGSATLRDVWQRAQDT